MLLILVIAARQTCAPSVSMNADCVVGHATSRADDAGRRLAGAVRCGAGFASSFATRRMRDARVKWVGERLRGELRSLAGRLAPCQPPAFARALSSTVSTELADTRSTSSSPI